MTVTTMLHRAMPGTPVDPGAARLRRVARLTGVAYLGLGVCGLVGADLIRGRFADPGDAAATATALVDHEALARVGLALDLGSVLAQALVAVGFYVLFRHVHAVAAAAVAAFGLVNAAMMLVGTALSATALHEALHPTVTAEGVPRLLYDLQGSVWRAAALFFGLWLLPMGWLAWHSGLMPRVLAWLLVVGGVGYILSALAYFTLPGNPTLVDVLVMPSAVAEIWMVGYLLFRGVASGAHPRGSMLRRAA
ncbi:MAG: DUF4386 domain-containing protein [Thermoleophilia bacterium]